MSHGSSSSLPTPDPRPRSGPGPFEDHTADQTTFLTRRAVGGDPKATEALIRRFNPWLLALASRHNSRGMQGLYAPDDLVGDVWLRVLPKLSNLRPNERGRLTPVFLSYVSRVLLNRHNTLMQKHLQGKPMNLATSSSRSEDFDPIAGLEDVSVDIVNEVIREERRHMVVEAIKQLSDEDQRALYLRGLQQIGNKDAAQLLGITATNMKTRYSRALKRLARVLTHEHREVLDDLLAEEEFDAPPSPRGA